MTYAVLLFAALTTPQEYAVTVVRVLDGDGIVVRFPDADQPWAKIFQTQSVRLIADPKTGLDAPEMHDRRPHVKALAVVSKANVERMCPPGSVVILTYPGMDKYGGRITAVVTARGVNVGQEQLKAGLAKPFDPRHKKESW